MKKKSEKNKFGQYFTPLVVADFMIGLAEISKNSKILEPSCGEGVFIDLLQKKGYYNLTAYEIDHSLAQNFSCVRYENFVSATIDDKFDLIIGNPPYIRWKNLESELKLELTSNLLWNQYFNSMCDYLYIFILKSIELLADGGQLIFICPEYWMNTGHSISLRNYMIDNGFFEQIYHFNETPIFEGVKSSIIVFKYIKSTKIVDKIKVIKFCSTKYPTSDILHHLASRIPLREAVYLDVSHFSKNERWLLEEDIVRNQLRKIEIACRKNSHLSLWMDDFNSIGYNTIGDVCDIGNGLVSGLDKAFQIKDLKLNSLEESSVINVIKAKDLNPFFGKDFTRYIFVDDDISEDNLRNLYPNFFSQLRYYINELNNRYQYGKKINYWNWVFLRNFKLFSRSEKRIFVPCKERISNKNYFRFALVDAGVFPTQDVTAIFKKQDTKESIEYILAYLNHSMVFDWLKSNGVIKGNIVEFSEKPIASIPYRKIDWNNVIEIRIHNEITDLVQNIINNHHLEGKERIHELFCQLIDWN